MKKFLVVLVLLLMAGTVYADSPLPTPQSPLPTPVSVEYPPVPPVDLAEINEWLASVGLLPLVLVAVEILKRVNVIPDGTAGRWSGVFSIVGFGALALLGVFGVDFANNTAIQNALEVLVRICQGILVVLGSPVLYKVLRELRVLSPLPSRV